MEFDVYTLSNTTPASNVRRKKVAESATAKLSTSRRKVNASRSYGTYLQNTDIVSTVFNQRG